ncbi:A-kinase anchor protein 13 isoform X3 [Gadus morhua]|uniref:A-kinase anchor protein 13 isoform X3 n=1 Tax=Gadus morhua TaxID=8049 RepID=UPI0011B7894A|nr:A-kinase anchor protein 13-like isoform X3 [Gadus morhua]
MGVNLSSQSSVTSDSAELPEEEGRPEEEEEGSGRDKRTIGGGVVMLEVTSEGLIGPSMETLTPQQKQETAAAAAAGGSSCAEEGPPLSHSSPDRGVADTPDARPDPEHGGHLHSIGGALGEGVGPENRQGAREEEEEEEETRGVEEEEETREVEEEEARGAETAAGREEARPAPGAEPTPRATFTPPVCPETPGSTEREQNPGTEPVPLTIREEVDRGEADKAPARQEMKTDVAAAAAGGGETSDTSASSPRGTAENPAPDPAWEERMEITEGGEVLRQEEPTESRGSDSGSDPSSADPSGSDPSGSDPSSSDPSGSDPSGSDASGQQNAAEGSEVRDQGEGVRTSLDRENPGAFELEERSEDMVDTGGCSSERLRESPTAEETFGTAAMVPSAPPPTPDSESAKCEDEENRPESKQEGSPTHQANVSTIHRDVEATCQPVHSSPRPRTVSQPAAGSSPSPSSRSVGACSDSVSDTDSSPGVETGNDNVFIKGEEVLTGGDSTSEVSLSSGDDPSSSPDSRQEAEAPGDGHWGPQEPGPAGAPGEADDEAQDRVTEVLLRPGRRSLSPPRRHSWGPGRNAAGPGSSSGADGDMNHRSYSLEVLSGEGGGPGGASARGPGPLSPPPRSWQEGAEGGARVPLRREQGGHRRLSEEKYKYIRPLRHSCPPMNLPLTKSVSMMALSQRDLDGMRPFSSGSCSLAYSISEEDTGSLRSDSEGRSGNRVGRTFSYLKNKMTRKSREKEKKTLNGHVFSPSSSPQATLCVICSKALSAKDFFTCSQCNASVHKGCSESLPPCLRVKIKSNSHSKQQKQQLVFPDSASFPVVPLRNRAPGMRDRPWSAILSPDEHLGPLSRRPVMPFHGNHLSKSLSISNIAGPVFDDMSGPIKSLRYLSQSTDSLSRTKPVTESLESLIDEGTEMEERQLMEDLEAEVKELEADSWTFTVDQSLLDTLTKDQTKRQDVIYELMQTEMHHVRTLRIMSEVYGKGLLRDAQLEQAAVDRMFPGLDDLLEIHTLFLTLLLDRRERRAGPDAVEGGAVVHRVGDLLLGQFSGASGELMKRVYGRFCGCHNEAVNFYKDLLNKDKHFQVSVKKKMSSSVVRRLGIPECILLVTQRITKYPVLIQRILQYTDESEEEHGELSQALTTVKEVLAAVDTRVNEKEKRRRLEDVHARMESKSITRMRSGQMFAREDLIRGRRLLREGALQLKNSQGRMKDVIALLLSDVFVFLQEKDQKYAFASLDQRSTVLSLHNLIVREVANEERGIFLISAGADRPEMLEVVAGSKEERNTWMQLIQDAMNAVDREDDEGIPSETEEDKRLMENKFKEMREALRLRDVQIVSLLEQKVQLFREMCECGGAPGSGDVALFRATSGLQPLCGEPIIKDALRQVETLQDLVNTTLGGLAPVVSGGGGGSLPRRAETFSGFDSRKNAARVQCQSLAVDLRRTGSDTVLKKGGNANLLKLRKNSEQVLHSVYQLHHLLSTLKAVVVQQDSLLEDQRQTLGERSSSFSFASSRPSSRPSSLIEQEKQRSVERRRQELASLHKEQAAHVEERRQREREWDVREQQLTDREVVLRVQEEEANQLRQDLEEENQEFQLKKEQYQRDLERLRDAQRKLDRDREGVQRDLDRLAQRTSDPSGTSDDYLPQPPGGSGSSEQGVPQPWPRGESLVRPQAPAQLPPLAPSKPKGRNLNPFSSGDGQVAGRLLQLAKNKDKDKEKEKKEKEKKKKKGKAGAAPGTGEESGDEDVQGTRL